jgi:hypothetical protein
MRAVEEALPANVPETPTLNGPVLLLGDTVVGEELKTKLTAQGATVHVLPHSADVDAAVAELNRIWAIAPAPHLIISTAREDGAATTEATWADRAARGMHVPYFVSQRWVQLVQEAGLVGKATLAAVTALGGDFGFGGRIAGVEGGGLMGLFKAIRREVNGLVVKAIDAPAEESPAQLAGYVLRNSPRRRRNVKSVTSAARGWCPRLSRSRRPRSGGPSRSRTERGLSPVALAA